MKRATLAAFLLALIEPGFAAQEIYKCQENGKTRYTQTPCQGENVEKLYLQQDLTSEQLAEAQAWREQRNAAIASLDQTLEAIEKQRKLEQQAQESLALKIRYLELLEERNRLEQERYPIYVVPQKRRYHSYDRSMQWNNDHWPASKPSNRCLGARPYESGCSSYNFEFRVGNSSLTYSR